MMKFMFVARRAPGQTRRGALDHLRDIHAKMVVCPPAGAGPMPLDYVQNHVIDGAYPGIGDHAIERDLVTELWFDSIDHLRASTATPYYLENLRPDEPRFVDDATVAKLMVRPRTLCGSPAGRFKTFLFLTRGDVNDAVWSAERETLANAFTASHGMIAAIENEVMPAPTGGPMFVDVVLEGWFGDADAAATALREGIARIVNGIARDSTFGVVAEQYDTMRLQALHKCGTSS